MKRGFTLVELSVVLVIIGLLISGVLIGQSMIETSKVNMQVKQIQQFDIAVANFTTAYASIPGDSKVLGCVNDELTDPIYSGQAGCGDGALQDSVTAGNLIPGIYLFDWEVSHFWVHLNKGVGFTQNGAAFTNVVTSSGFNISSSPRNAPQAVIDNKTGVVATTAFLDWANRITISSYFLADFSSLDNSMSNSERISQVGKYSLTPVQALAIDTKMDDGLPFSGNVQSIPIGPNDTGYLTYGAQAVNCAASGKYLSSNARTCALAIQIMSGSGGMQYRSTNY